MLLTSNFKKFRKMARKKNGNSVDYEIEQMSKAELARLQRQYRIMEGDREAYSEEVKILLQKQRKTISILEKEKKELLYTLSCAKSQANESKIERKVTKLKQLLTLHNKLEKDIAREKSQIKELDFQINKLQKEFLSTKPKFKLQNCNEEESEDKIKAKQQLENRLDVAIIKLNKLQTSNQEYRQKIDHYLKERTTFNHSYQELNTRLNSGKKKIMDLMEQSTQAYDQREEAQAKLEAIKQKGSLDVLIHSQEMKELQRQLDYDSKLQNFLGVKGQKRIMADLEAKETLKRQQEKEALEKQIQKYQLLLDEIKKISEESNIDRLSAQFLKQEEENFALFNYVNELNNELEALQEQVEEIKKSAEEQRIESETKANQKEVAIKILEEELNTSIKNTKEAEEELDKARNVSNQILKGLEFSYELLKTDSNALLQLLGK